MGPCWFGVERGGLCASGEKQAPRWRLRACTHAAQGRDARRAAAAAVDAACCRSTTAAPLMALVSTLSRVTEATDAAALLLLLLLQTQTKRRGLLHGRRRQPSFLPCLQAPAGHHQRWQHARPLLKREDYVKPRWSRLLFLPQRRGAGVIIRDLLLAACCPSHLLVAAARLSRVALCGERYVGSTGGAGDASEGPQTHSTGGERLRARDASKTPLATAQPQAAKHNNHRTAATTCIISCT